MVGEGVAPSCLPEKTASTRGTTHDRLCVLPCRWTQVAENPTVAGHVEPIEARPFVASPVALRVLVCLRFLTMVKSFNICNRIYTSAWNETRCGAG
jgi:hypothetical protein